MQPIQRPSKSELARQRTQPKNAVPQAQPPRAAPTVAAVAERAYAKYLARGAGHGHAFEDWIAAEQEAAAEGRAQPRS